MITIATRVVSSRLKLMLKARPKALQTITEALGRLDLEAPRLQLLDKFVV